MSIVVTSSSLIVDNVEDWQYPLVLNLNVYEFSWVASVP